MDLSKLPKLSETPAPPEPISPAPSQTPARNTLPIDDGMVGAEVWLSAIIGLVFLLLGRNFALYLFSLITHRPYHTAVNWTSGAHAGEEVAYPDLVGYVMYTDASMFLFGLALLFEAIILAAVHSRIRSKKPLVLIALLVAVVATALNLIVALMLFSAGILPLFSLLAVAFGGYIVAHEWRMLQALPGATSPRA